MEENMAPAIAPAPYHISLGVGRNAQPGVADLRGRDVRAHSWSWLVAVMGDSVGLLGCGFSLFGPFLNGSTWRTILLFASVRKSSRSARACIGTLAAASERSFARPAPTSGVRSGIFIGRMRAWCAHPTIRLATRKQAACFIVALPLQSVSMSMPSEGTALVPCQAGRIVALVSGLLIWAILLGVSPYLMVSDLYPNQQTGHDLRR
jgi:hypothetical protein